MKTFWTALDITKEFLYCVLIALAWGAVLAPFVFTLEFIFKFIQ